MLSYGIIPKYFVFITDTFPNRCKDGNVQFTTVLLKALSEHKLNISSLVFFTNKLKRLLQENRVIIRIRTLKTRKTINILHIIDNMTVLKVLL